MIKLATTSEERATPMALEFKRDYTADRLNLVVNDASVFSHVALPGQVVLDLSPIAADLRNVILMTLEGGIVAHQQEPGVYEIHTQFTERCRGTAAVRLVREMISWMFTHTDAVELQTKIPKSNQPALGLVRAISGRFEFTREGVWPKPDGTFDDIDYYTLRYNDWLYSEWASKTLIPLGHEFHETLEVQKLAIGITEAPHGEDVAHDLNVGATVAMIRAGQLDKGLILYNRWARFAGYAEIGLVSRAPLVLDIFDSLLEVQGENFSVVRGKAKRTIGPLPPIAPKAEAQPPVGD